MPLTELIDLAGARLGGAALLANDEFFAPKESLLRPEPPVWREGEYTDRGKWMDGWETRRRREPGHDWCIVRLGCPGLLREVVVDTSHFTGNYPEACSLDACRVPAAAHPADLAADDGLWTEVLPRSPLAGDTANRFAIHDQGTFTHVRLNIVPDGGVARLRVHGVVRPDWERLSADGAPLDLAAAAHGGLVVAASDMHYGDPLNMLMPGLAAGMHDGWETRRRRGPGHEWAIVRLGRRGALRRAVLDTSHFKGNAPGACSLDCCDAGDARLPGEGAEWHELLPRTPLLPHTVHEWAEELRAAGPATHVRLNTFPDGGVARLRLYGTVA